MILPENLQKHPFLSLNDNEANNVAKLPYSVKIKESIVSVTLLLGYNYRDGGVEGCGSHNSMVHGDCWEHFFLGVNSCEIKGHLLLGRKATTNLDSIFKIRDITLPTKVHLVRAMVFPVVMYGCESWTVKKAER